MNGRIPRIGVAMPIKSYCSSWCRAEARNVRGSVSRQVPKQNLSFHALDNILGMLSGVSKLIEILSNGRNTSARVSVEQLA